MLRFETMNTLTIIPLMNYELWGTVLPACQSILNITYSIYYISHLCLSLCRPNVCGGHQCCSGWAVASGTKRCIKRKYSYLPLGKQSFMTVS